MDKYYSGWNFSRFLYASFLIFATTADDAIWLLPLITSTQYRVSQRLYHGALFVATLLTACIVSYIISVAFASSVQHMGTVKLFGLKSEEVSVEYFVQLVAVIMTWLLAIFFLAKATFKHWRKNSRTVYQNLEDFSRESSSGHHRWDVVEVEPTTRLVDNSKYQTVIVLTLTGAIDEILCFPSLLWSRIFTIQELFFGCLFASVLIVVIITSFLSLFQPLLTLFDRIPFYVVVFIIAIIQTIDLCYTEKL